MSCTKTTGCLLLPGHTRACMPLDAPRLDAPKRGRRARLWAWLYRKLTKEANRVA
jgi:hypothetical protein